MSDQISQGILSPFLREKRIQMVKPYLRGNVLDVGCGSGRLAVLVSKDNYFGFDIDCESIAIAQNNFVYHKFATDPPLDGQAFDTIVCMAVIEHDPEPTLFLRRWSKYLSKSSYSCIVITTPHPRVEWIHYFGARLGLFSKDGCEEHETLIDYKAMRGIVQKAGMKIVFFQTFMFGMNQLFVLSRP